MKLQLDKKNRVPTLDRVSYQNWVQTWDYQFSPKNQTVLLSEDKNYHGSINHWLTECARIEFLVGVPAGHTVFVELREVDDASFRIHYHSSTLGVATFVSYHTELQVIVTMSACLRVLEEFRGHSELGRTGHCVEIKSLETIGLRCTQREPKHTIGPLEIDSTDIVIACVKKLINIKHNYYFSLYFIKLKNLKTVLLTMRRIEVEVVVFNSPRVILSQTVNDQSERTEVRIINISVFAVAGININDTVGEESVGLDIASFESVSENNLHKTKSQMNRYILFCSSFCLLAEKAAFSLKKWFDFLV